MHILVADDHPGYAESLAALLEECCPSGTSTAIALDGREALAAAGRERPDVVILDIEMPVMNGMDAAVALRAQLGAPAPLLIATTGSPDHALASSLTGVFAVVLAKPVQIEQLLAVVLARPPRVKASGDGTRCSVEPPLAAPPAARAGGPH